MNFAVTKIKNLLSEDDLLFESKMGIYMKIAGTKIEDLLSEREIYILQTRPERLLHEYREPINVSRERARQLQKKALSRLQKYLDLIDQPATMVLFVQFLDKNNIRKWFREDEERILQSHELKWYKSLGEILYIHEGKKNGRN